MNIIGGTGSGIDQLLIAAQSLGDHPYHQSNPEKDNLHGYARSPPDRACTQNGQRDRAREKKEPRIRFEPRERQRPGGRLEHNRLEKDRRAQLKQNFNNLKEVIPSLRERKASNQAILKAGQKCIQNLSQQNRRLEQEVQRQAAERAQRVAALERAKERYEHISGFSANQLLESLINADVEDLETVTTLSATESGDNYQEYLDEDDGEIFKQRTAAEVPVPKGIPHPVIRQAPHSQGSMRQAENSQVQLLQTDVPASAPTHTAATANTVKKLHAKLTTKQPPATQGSSSAASPASAPKSQVVRVTRPPQSPVTAISTTANRVVRPKVSMLPLTMAGPVVTLPGSQIAVGQSLLQAQTLSSYVPPMLRGGTVTVSSSSVLVPGVAASAQAPRLTNGQVSPLLSQSLALKEVGRLVNPHTHQVVLTTPQSWYLMANALPNPSPSKPTMSTHAVL